MIYIIDIYHWYFRANPGHTADLRCSFGPSGTSMLTCPGCATVLDLSFVKCPRDCCDGSTVLWTFVVVVVVVVVVVARYTINDSFSISTVLSPSTPVAVTCCCYVWGWQQQVSMVTREYWLISCRLLYSVQLLYVSFSQQQNAETSNIHAAAAATSVVTMWWPTTGQTVRGTCSSSKRYQYQLVPVTIA